MNSLIKSKFYLNKPCLTRMAMLKINFRLFCSKENIISLEKTEDFDNIIKNSKVPVLVDFYADWCGPCKRLTPILESKQKEKNNFKLLKINVDNHGDLAQKFDVQGIPHVLLFKDGKKSGEFVGLNEGALNNMVSKL